MVAPLALMGILGAGVGSVLKPHLDNYAASVAGKYNQRVLDGTDRSDPNSVTGALFDGGLLSGRDVASDTRQGFEGEADRAAAMARQHVASGPAWARVSLDRMIADRKAAQLDFERVREQGITRLMIEQGVDPQLVAIPEVRAGFAAAHGENTRAAMGGAGGDIVAGDVAMRGRAWAQMAPEARAEVLGLENGIETLVDVLDYAQNTTAASRAGDRQTAAELATRFQTTALPLLQKMFAAGAMQEAEQELFLDLAGNPFGVANLSDAQYGRLAGLIGRAEEMLAITSRSHGIAVPDRGDLPPGLVPGRIGQ
ncbi:MAG: hypothetical protein ACPGNV_18095 [Mangrovicoccus sp.]